MKKNALKNQDGPRERLQQHFHESLGISENLSSMKLGYMTNMK
jgi:hypothetical protein